MVHESLLRALKDNGLEEILAEGKEFDPVLRPSMVKVNQ